MYLFLKIRNTGVSDITFALNTAAALIADMVSFGVLVEITGQRRNRLFVFEDYLKLFRSPS